MCVTYYNYSDNVRDTPLGSGSLQYECKNNTMEIKVGPLSKWNWLLLRCQEVVCGPGMCKIWFRAIVCILRVAA